MKRERNDVPLKNCALGEISLLEMCVALFVGIVKA